VKNYLWKFNIQQGTFDHNIDIRWSKHESSSILRSCSNGWQAIFPGKNLDIKQTICISLMRNEQTNFSRYSINIIKEKSNKIILTIIWDMIWTVAMNHLQTQVLLWTADAENWPLFDISTKNIQYKILKIPSLITLQLFKEDYLRNIIP